MKPHHLAALMIACFAPGAVQAGPDRVSLLLGSHHVDAKYDFNERNPGVFLTWERSRVDWTVGVYDNSFGKPSVAVTAALPVTQWERGEVSLFAGLALYPGDGRYFAVHAGDVVPIGGLQVRHGNVFMQVIPSDGVITDAIVSFGLTFQIGQ